MKVVILNGSARKNGTTAALLQHFQKGLEAAGHEFYRFDAAFHDVHPCIGCDKCRRTGSCAFAADDMKELNPHLLAADALVFVSPIYYFDLNAQLKTVIDRFYANDAALCDGKKAVLLTAMADTDPATAEAANACFTHIARYHDWQIAGILNIGGCSGPEDLTHEDCRRAYQLALGL